MRTKAVVFGVLLAWTLPCIALAQEAGSERVYEQALRHRRRHHPERALELLRAHHEATHEPRALASMGLAEMDLEHFDTAEQHLSAALSGAPNPWIEAHRAELETELQRCRQHLGVGAILVRCAADGAEVFFNGARVGAAGAAVRVRAGSVSYEVRAAGYRTARRTVEVTLGATVTEQVDLEREPTVAPTPAVVESAPSRTAPRPPAAPVARPSTETVETPPPVVTEAPQHNTRRTLAWVSAAGAAVFLGVGVAGQVVGQNAADQWNEGAECNPPDGRSRIEACGSEGYDSTANTMSVLRGVGFVGGGVLAAVSVVLFVTSSRPPPSRSAFACGTGPGTLGVACGGSF
jgi:hypothetical protein